jgi:CheY-like chemotaxis protein
MTAGKHENNLSVSAGLGVARFLNPLPLTVDRQRADVMLTSAQTTTTTSATRRVADDAGETATAAQKVVIVNGGSEILELLETTLESGHYDVVFVEPGERAYAQIRLIQPHLVILCMRIEDVGGFQILSMLKLDRETKHIPVLTYTTEYEGQQTEEDVADTSDEKMFPQKLVLRMN